MQDPRIASRQTGRRVRAERGFTLVEIMIVVAITALLASIAVPSYLRARKRSQATRVLTDLRVIDNAIDLYAIENNKASGTKLKLQDLRAYMKRGSRLYTTGKDIFGNSYGSFKIDQPPKVPTKTKRELADVVEPEFWAPYR